MGALGEVVRGGSTLGWWFLGLPFANTRILASTRTRKEAQTEIQARGQRALERCGFSLEVTGEPPPPGQGCVVVYNETSFADSWAFHAAMWPHLERASGAFIFALIPTMSAMCKRAGVALVPRKNRAAAEKVIQEMVSAAKAGERVAWGGEGRMAGRDEVLRFKVGSALIAIRAGVPLVPVAFWGGHHRLPLRGLRARPGLLKVRFGAPISTQGLGEDAVRPLADKAQAAVAELYAQLGAGAA
jgi:1-acyl-sn-glycerol-3-phosphate acyltransferase